MSRSETSTLPPPATQEQIDAQTVRKVNTIVDRGRELIEAEQRFLRQLQVEGYDVKTLDDARMLLKHARRLAMYHPQGMG